MLVRVHKSWTIRRWAGIKIRLNYRAGVKWPISTDAAGRTTSRCFRPRRPRPLAGGGRDARPELGEADAPRVAALEINVGGEPAHGGRRDRAIAQHVGH